LGFLPPIQSRHRGRKKKGEPGKRRQGGECDARRRRRVAAETGRVREAPFVFKGEAPFVFEREPDRSTPWTPTSRHHPRHDCFAFTVDPR
jgi:hypothetical protein